MRGFPLWFDRRCLLEVPEVVRAEAVVLALETPGRRLRRARGSNERLVCFDTGDLALSRRGIALVLGRDRRGWLLTARWPRAVESPGVVTPIVASRLDGGHEAPLELPEGDVRTALAGRVAGRPLGAIAVVSRRTRRFELDAAAEGAPPVVIGLRKVRARDGDGTHERATWTEIELRGDDPGAVDAVARELAMRFPLLEPGAPAAARVLRAVHGDAPVWDLPASDPGRGDDLAAASRAILAKQLRRILDEDPGTRVGEDPEALHDMRVAVRRSRAALRLFQAGLPARVHSFLARELRWLGKILGDVRDLDVQRERLREAGRALPPDLGRALERYDRRVGSRRDEARNALLAGLESARYARLIVRLDRFVRARPARVAEAARVPLVDHAGESIARMSKRVRKLGDRLRKEPDVAGLHRLRIRIKRLRYLVEFLGPLAGRPGERFVREATRLQDVLGMHQDAVVAESTLREVLAAEAAVPDPEERIALGILVGREIGLAEGLRGQFDLAWRRFRSPHVDAARRGLRRRLRVGRASGRGGNPAGEV